MWFYTFSKSSQKDQSNKTLIFWPGIAKLGDKEWFKRIVFHVFRKI